MKSGFRLMKTKTLLVLAGATSILASCATDSSNYAAPRSLESQFQRADTNNDEKVSKAEFEVLAVENAFAMFDDNSDGVLTKAEFLNSGGSAAEFDELDLSGSGTITLEEAKASKVKMSRMLAAFYEADTDKDGYVTLGEALERRKQVREIVR